MVLDRAAHFPSGPRVRATETMKITEIIEMGRREIETPPPTLCLHLGGSSRKYAHAI